MNFKELVLSRRSVRSYKRDDVEQEKLDYILSCAVMAPSACNRQPWKFVVLKGALKDKVCTTHKFTWVSDAPLVIAVCVNHTEAWHRGYDNKDHADIDAAIATEHLVIAAAEQGLGTCWICSFNATECAGILGLNPDEEVVALIPVGYEKDASVRRVITKKELSQVIIK